jgi:hypothetical protein
VSGWVGEDPLTDCAASLPASPADPVVQAHGRPHAKPGPLAHVQGGWVHDDSIVVVTGLSEHGRLALITDPS